MKNILKTGKFALGVLLGSLLWAGCASNAPQGSSAQLEQTIDLQNTGPETHPAWTTSADPFRDMQNPNAWDVESIQ
jgi:hypothetical protein